jgi:hypothetical protein
MQTSFTCPLNGAAYGFEIPDDDVTLARCWHGQLHIECPHCERTHVVPFRNLYVTGVMSEFACVPVDVQRGNVH